MLDVAWGGPVSRHRVQPLSRKMNFTGKMPLEPRNDWDPSEADFQLSLALEGEALQILFTQ